MADNYLEKRYEEVFGRGSVRTSSFSQSLDVLLARNRSCRGYDKSYVVHRFQLEAIIRVNTRVASACNAQRLRFKPVLKGEKSRELLSCLKLGGALPDLCLPVSGTEPEAFIVVCTSDNPSRDIYTDLGISCQSMLLKATEMGLAGVIVFNFDALRVKEILSLDMEPLAVIPIGRSIERSRLVEVTPESGLKYYRDEDGTHCVPKLRLEDIVLKD